MHWKRLFNEVFELLMSARVSISSDTGTATWYSSSWASASKLETIKCPECMVSLMAFVVWGSIITSINRIFIYYSKPRQSCQLWGKNKRRKNTVLTAAAMLGITYYYYIDARRIHQQSTHIIFYYKIADKLTNDRAYGMVCLRSVHVRRLNVFELVTHVRRTAKTFLKKITLGGIMIVMYYPNWQ